MWVWEERDQSPQGGGCDHEGLELRAHAQWGWEDTLQGPCPLIWQVTHWVPVNYSAGTDWGGSKENMQGARHQRWKETTAQGEGFLQSKEQPQSPQPVSAERKLCDHLSDRCRNPEQRLAPGISVNRRQSCSSRLHVHVSQKWHCIWELWLCQATVSSALSSDEVSFYNSLLLELAKTSVLSFFFFHTQARLPPTGHT